MRLFAGVLAVVVALAFAPFVQAGPKVFKAGGSARTITGKVVKLSGTTLTIEFTNKKGQTKERKIKTDDKTKVLLNGKTIALSDLNAGQSVEITLERRVATEIVVTPSGKSAGGPAAAGASTH